MSKQLEYLVTLQVTIKTDIPVSINDLDESLQILNTDYNIILNEPSQVISIELVGKKDD